MQAITLRAGLERKSLPSMACAAIKLQARALAYPLLTRGWLKVLNSHGALRELARLQPRLLHKIYRPYLSSRLDRPQRLAALAAHYRFVVQHDLGATVAQAVRGPLVLARFEGKSGAVYQVDLRAIVPMEREGELVLQLRCAGALVYSVAFSFLADGAQTHAASVGVGCLQGPQCGAGLELGREATRDLHGLRRKTCCCAWCSNSATPTAAARCCWWATTTAPCSSRSARAACTPTTTHSGWRWARSRAATATTRWPAARYRRR